MLGLNAGMDFQSDKNPISLPLYQRWPSAFVCQTLDSCIDVQTGENPISSPVYQKQPLASVGQRLNLWIYSKTIIYPTSSHVCHKWSSVTIWWTKINWYKPNQPHFIPETALRTYMTETESRNGWSNWYKPSQPPVYQKQLLATLCQTLNPGTDDLTINISLR